MSVATNAAFTQVLIALNNIPPVIPDFWAGTISVPLSVVIGLRELSWSRLIKALASEADIYDIYVCFH